MTTIPLPRYLQVAHWLLEQQRLVGSREAALVFEVSPWSMDRDFAKIRRISSIVMFDEQCIPSKGGQQCLLRVVHIHPYRLDERLNPHRLEPEEGGVDGPLTWRDLLGRPWGQLVRMQQRRGCHDRPAP